MQFAQSCEVNVANSQGSLKKCSQSPGQKVRKYSEDNLKQKYKQYQKEIKKEIAQEDKVLCQNNCVALKIIMQNMKKNQKIKDKSIENSESYFAQISDQFYKLDQISDLATPIRSPFLKQIQEEINLIIHNREYSDNNKQEFLNQKLQALKLIARQHLPAQQAEINMLEILQQQYQKITLIAQSENKDFYLNIEYLPNFILSDIFCISFLTFNLLYFSMKYCGKLVIKSELNGKFVSIKFILQGNQQMKEIQKKLNMKYLLNEEKLIKYLKKSDPVLLGITSAVNLLDGSIKIKNKQLIQIKVKSLIGNEQIQ